DITDCADRACVVHTRGSEDADESDERAPGAITSENEAAIRNRIQLVLASDRHEHVVLVHVRGDKRGKTATVLEDAEEAADALVPREFRLREDVLNPVVINLRRARAVVLVEQTRHRETHIRSGPPLSGSMLTHARRVRARED